MAFSRRVRVNLAKGTATGEGRDRLKSIAGLYYGRVASRATVARQRNPAPAINATHIPAAA